MSSVQGGCLCGAVKFSIELPVKWSAHCHCTMCQRAHGAAFVTWVGVPEPQFSLTGEVGRYQSSKEAVRTFCRTCGSPMLFESEKWPGEVHVALAAIDGDVEHPPTAHVYYETRCAFFEPADALPKKTSQS